MPPEIQVELNKLEPAASRAAVTLSSATAYRSRLRLRLDVFLFDRAGIILRRFGLTFLDIRAERSKVVLFDLPEVECGNVGRLVVNDVIACTVASEEPLAGCSPECGRARGPESRSPTRADSTDVESAVVFLVPQFDGEPDPLRRKLP